MKYDLITMVQEILSDMDSDEVNSITSTAEAQQVARCIRQTYYNIIEDIDPPQHYIAFNFVDTSTASPTILTLPTRINKLVWVKYNKIAFGETAPFIQQIDFMDKAEFFHRMYLLNTDDGNVDTYNYTVDGTDVPIIYRLDRQPTYYTTLDNSGTVLFDSYDSSVGDNLVGSKAYGYGRKGVTFDLSDGFVPDLEEPMFTRLLNEAKVLAFAELKSVDHAIANRDAKRARNRSYNNKFRTPRLSSFDQLANFGRK